MAKAIERLMLPLTRRQLPEIVDLSLLMEGIFHGGAVIAISKTFPGQARRVMQSLWSAGWLAGARLLLVVDSDVDPHDLSAAVWRTFNNVNWQRDLIIADHFSDGSAVSTPFGGRLGIDATRKVSGEITAEWPEEIRMAEAVKELVTRRWRDYGFGEGH
jgi:4-hydroxy-3-polyprenylbenzoate decarboxylase